MRILATARRLAFRIPSGEARFERRGFPEGDKTVRERLEKVIETFIEGYHAALSAGNGGELVESLDDGYDHHHVGFAYEGTGLYYSMLDLVVPRKRSRLRRFIEGPAAKHDYIAAVGAGFAIARIPWGRRKMERFMYQQDPMVAWCVPDGYGFHQGFFHHRETIDECRRPPSHLPKFAHQLYDSGVGRSLWWVKSGDVQSIGEAIGRFPEERRGEMWCGIGVAAAYAGGVEADSLPGLLDRAGRYRDDFMSGVPFAARMRQKGGNPSEWTELACRSLVEMSADEAADAASECAEDITRTRLHSAEEKRESAYRLLREHLSRKMGLGSRTPEISLSRQIQPREATTR